jgi:hypothetical protein
MRIEINKSVIASALKEPFLNSTLLNWKITKPFPAETMSRRLPLGELKYSVLKDIPTNTMIVKFQVSKLVI